MPGKCFRGAAATKQLFFSRHKILFLATRLCLYNCKKKVLCQEKRILAVTKKKCFVARKGGHSIAPKTTSANAASASP